MPSNPTVQRRRLAAELRRLRDQAGMNADDAAREADISKSALWRIEAGAVKPRVPVIRSLLLAYRTEPQLVEVLIQLAREAAQRGWWHQYGGTFPDWFEVYVGLEADATALRMFQIQLIPGILQTEAYAREVIAAEDPKAPAETVARKVAFRMARQDILQREQPTEIWTVLDEAALRRQVGGPAVMREQLETLRELADHRAVTLQILPYDAGAHPAMGTPFTILTFGRDPDVIYLDNPASGLYLERPDQIARFTLAFDHLRAAALAPGPSTAKLQALLKEHNL